MLLLASSLLLCHIVKGSSWWLQLRPTTPPAWTCINTKGTGGRNPLARNLQGAGGSYTLHTVAAFLMCHDIHGHVQWGNYQYRDIHARLQLQLQLQLQTPRGYVRRARGAIRTNSAV